MATQGDRSLGAGISFPKWMKTKMNDKFDLDQSTFSPTELDDSFMYYYRYPKSKETTNTQGNTINVTITEGSKVIASTSENGSNLSADFSKISENSQKFLTGDSLLKEASKTTNLTSKPKGTDDGFHGEPSTVGSSVLKVAHQMVSGKKVLNPEPAPEEQCEQLLAKFDPYRRRGSKSLPASPLTSPGSSPKAKRRGVNKYFTGTFNDNKQGGWILSNLLARREISQSVGFINEESKEELERAASTMSVDEGNMKNKNQVFKAKPSELREMNFWSPTSM